MIKIIGVGDIMPGGLLHGSKSPFISDKVMAYLALGDIRVGTLECAIGNSPDFIEEKMNKYGDVIYAPDEDLKRLKEMNINLVSLANNHFFDLKASGAFHTTLRFWHFVIIINIWDIFRLLQKLPLA